MSDEYTTTTTDYDLGLKYDMLEEDWDLEGDYSDGAVSGEYLREIDTGTGAGSDDGLSDKYMGPLAQTYLEVQGGIQEALINSETAIKTAQIDAYGTMQAAQADAISRMYEADALVEKGKNDNETDIAICEAELEFKREELELKYAELEFKYYEVDNVKTYQAMGMYYKGLGDYTESQGEYAESVADATATSGSDSSWDSAAGLV